MGEEITEKINSLKFRENLKEMNEVNIFYLIFQRFNKFKYLYLLCNVEEFSKNNDGENELIVFNRQPNLKNFNFDKNFEIDEETLNCVEITTDKEFKQACILAYRKCHKLARLFLAFEFISKFSDLFLIVILPISRELHFTRIDIIIIITILVPIVILQIICDWGKLLEKYSRLCWEFSKLKNSKNNDRLYEYSKFVSHFKSSWVYSDMILPTNDI